jgi:hypothetical protein
MIEDGARSSLFGGHECEPIFIDEQSMTRRTVREESIEGQASRFLRVDTGMT